MIKSLDTIICTVFMLSIIWYFLTVTKIGRIMLFVIKTILSCIRLILLFVQFIHLKICKLNIDLQNKNLKLLKIKNKNKSNNTDDNVIDLKQVKKQTN